jgi:type I restriction enzyme, S subunit
MNEWRELSLGDIGRTVTGKTPSTSIAEFFGGDIPFVTPSDMDGRKVIFHAARGLTQAGVAAVKSSRIPKGSVMVSCIGSDMGKVAIAGRDCLTNQQINSIIVSENFCRDFVYYNLSTRQIELQNLAGGGSAQPILNKGRFSQLPIRLPALSEQRAIASVLGALDEKVELNRRMNETLEALAHTLFQEMIGDRTAANIGRFEQLATLSRETINPNEFPEETFEYYSIPAFDERRWPKPEMGEQIKSNKFLVPANSVMISKLNPRIPRVWMPSVNTTHRSVASTEFLVAIPKPGTSRQWLYGLFTFQPFLDVFATLVTGTSGSHQRVKPEYLLAMEVEIPPTAAIERYTKTVAPLHERIATNLQESRTLAALRDALLPKLLSGELCVTSAASKN